MEINWNDLFLYLLMFVLIYLTYTAYTLKNKIWCSFRRRDRSKVEKWAIISKKGKWNDIEFDGGLYHVEPKRTVLVWRMMLGFFPMPVRCLDFRHDSSRALDPDTFENTFTPEERLKLDASDDIRQLGEANDRALPTTRIKQGMFEKLMPIITIGGFIVFGYLLWMMKQDQNQIGNQSNVIMQQLGEIKSIINSLGK